MSDEREKEEAEAMDRFIEEMRKKLEEEFLRGKEDPSFAFFEEKLAEFRKENK